MEPFTLPEEKLNDLAQKVSATLFDRHYFENDLIRGEELKSFAEHEQVNRFLIFQVFQVWEMQINKLYHPYFNLEQTEIKQTLQALKNQISRCIEISKGDFQPMLKRAVYNNLKLLLSPKETFESFFFAQQETIKLNVYERYAQFFSDLNFVTDIILQYHRKNGLERVQKEVFFSKMEKVAEAFARKSGQSFDQYRQDQFLALTGLRLEDLVVEAEAEIQAREAQKQREEAEARRIAEAEAQRIAEAEARRREEEAQRRAQEEAIRRAEEERKRMSFFDTLSVESKSGGFDLDLDDLDAPTPTSEPVTPASEPEPEPLVPSIKIEQPPAPTPEPAPQPVAQTNHEEPPTPPQAPPTIEQVDEPTAKEEVTKEEAQPPTVEAPVADEPEKPIIEEPVEETPQEEEPVTPPIAKTESTADFLDRFLSERQKRETEAKTESPESAPEPEPEAPVAEKTPEPEISAPPVVSTPSEPSKEERPTSVLDRINERSRTVADRFSKPKAPLAETINSNRKIKLDEIPIHKQYQYVQKVFEGNNVRFRIIVDKVNNAQNKDEVEDILNKFVLSNDSLDRNDHVVREFIELLRNRY